MSATTARVEVLAADGTAGLAFVSTNTATAAAVLGWVAIEWFHRGKPTVLGGALTPTALMDCRSAIVPCPSPQTALVVPSGNANPNSGATK